MVLKGLTNGILGVFIDVLIVVFVVQTGIISPAKSLQENIVVGIIVFVVKLIIKQLFFR